MQGIHFLLVAIGGAGGAVLRYSVQQWAGRLGAHAPYLATAFANLTGALLLGIFFGIATRNGFLSSPARLLLTTGFCGGYTTFSTFTAETFTLLEQGQYLTATAYLLGSLLGALLLFALGFWLTKA